MDLNTTNKKNINADLNILSLFDGMSVAQEALKENNISVNKYYASEIDPYAIATTQYNFPKTIQLGDVRQLDVNKLENIDLLIGGSPCFTKGTKIMTNNGYKNIEYLEIGDKVYTHKFNYKPIEKIGNKISNIYQINAQGILPIETTPEHPFYIREMKKLFNKENKKYERVFSNPKWKKVENIKHNDFIAIPIIKNEKEFGIDETDAWLLGRYVADGYLRTGLRNDRKNSYHHLITFCIGKNKANKFINQNKYHIGKVKERTFYKYRIINKKLHSLCLQCGQGALNKTIPSFILNSNKNIAESFLNGYMSGDGCYTNNKFKATTISKELALSLSLLIAKIYKVGANIYMIKNPNKCIIEGRTVNQSNIYEICFQKEARKQNHQWTDDRFIWFPIKKVIKTNEYKSVYNIQVEEDHTYTANNVIVHNCQDLSIAKQNREGLKGERSGLFYEYVRILNELKPKYFILENVNSMPKDAKNTISEILGVDPIMINASLVSAQNRKRLFWIGALQENGTYKQIHIFLPNDKGIVLKDILEDNVDKKYCVNVAEKYSTKGFCEVKFKSKAMTASMCKVDGAESVTTIRVASINTGGQGDRIYGEDGKSVSLSANGGGRGAKTGLYLINEYNKRIMIEKSGTLGTTMGRTAKQGYQVVDEQNSVIRKLTPRECLRLQSMPDNYFDNVIYKNKQISDTQRYKMCGNAFNCEVIKHILKFIF